MRVSSHGTPCSHPAGSRPFWRPSTFTRRPCRLLSSAPLSCSHFPADESTHCREILPSTANAPPSPSPSLSLSFFHISPLHPSGTGLNPCRHSDQRLTGQALVWIVTCVHVHGLSLSPLCRHPLSSDGRARGARTSERIQVSSLTATNQPRAFIGASEAIPLPRLEGNLSTRTAPFATPHQH